MIRTLLSAAGWRGQMGRYLASGAALALLYSAVYWTLATLFGVPALLANTAAFLANLVAGWAIHSRWSFAGHGSERRPRSAYGRFVAVNLGGWALNSLWVWLIVHRLDGSVTASLLPIVLVTPLAMFWANRRWTFS